MINLLTFFAPRILFKPIGQIRPHRRDESWSASLWTLTRVPPTRVTKRHTTGWLIKLLTFLARHMRLKHRRWLKAEVSNPTLNGHLKYPNNLDQSLNEAATDKIRKYRPDYNNRPPSAVSFIPAIASTSGRLHSEFVRLLFFKAHRETDRFFASSGVQPAQTQRDMFHFRRADFSSGLKDKVDLALVKAVSLRINLNLDGAPIASKSHTHPSHSQTSRLLTSSLSLGVPVPRPTQCVRGA